MTGTSTLDDFSELRTLPIGRRNEPTRPLAGRVRANKLRSLIAQNVAVDAPAMPAPQPVAAAARQNAQLPAFAPLLEELEVAGWSSNRRKLSGNFHDWLLLEGRTLLVMTGQAVADKSSDSIDPIEAALVAQGTWASIRSHARHATDAGMLLTLAARSLWTITSASLRAAVAIALVDLDGGHTSVATAGDCLALKIRAAGAEQIATTHPALGASADFVYPNQSIQLSLRERIVLVADEAACRPAKLAARIVGNFSQLDAESHRRMMASDAVAMVRECYEPQVDENGRASASIVAVRRR